MKLRVKLKNQNPPDKKNLISPKRAFEVSDSLEKVGYATVRAAGKLKDKALKDKSEIGIKGSDYLMSSGMKDLKNAERYRALANKALEKK
jgi:hypothetical protein